MGAEVGGRMELKRETGRGEKIFPQENGENVSAGGFRAGAHRHSIPSGCVALKVEGHRGAVSAALPADSVPMLRCCREKRNREIVQRVQGGNRQ